MKPYQCTEYDWKLFKKIIQVYQERFAEKLRQKYIDILQCDKTNLEKFFLLEDSIYHDKKRKIFNIDMRRSQLVYNLIILLKEGSITLQDCNDFSEPLKNILASFIQTIHITNK